MWDYPVNKENDEDQKERVRKGWSATAGDLAPTIPWREAL